ncbi:MAG TPA: toll/interleukin-1 receptor domain-containing protein [Patescibacteria group bacterium]|nr:toll/interleukin-1 receptor domain-containing protein [Patescibacteria group bacterium]
MPFGISAFVAHTDIRPTKEWQEEIAIALASMDAFVALLTEKFHTSEWTDQEVGYALGRGVPLIAVKLGEDPYGFIGKFQALACDWGDAPLELAKLLVKQPRMIDAFVEAVPRCTSFDEGNMLSGVLPSIETLTVEQAECLASAFNEKNQLQGSYGFTGERPAKYGPGLAAHLARATCKGYEIRATGDAWPRAWRIGPKKR